MLKILRFAAALCACLFLSGCSFPGLDAKNLMAPPKADGDQQSIHKLLQGNRPDVAFVYPQNGEHRSAVIMQDFTGDGQDDALGFYSLEDGRGVEVQFLTKNSGEWKTVAVFQNISTQVDRVCFGDLNGDGTSDALIGWGSAAGTTGRTAAVNAYLFEDGDVTEYPLGTYGEMAVTDLDHDGVNEVFTIDKFLPAAEEGAEPSPAQARVYVFEGGAPREAARADADNSISNYVSLSFGRLTPSLWGVTVDGAKADGSLTTQVFYLEGNALINAPEGVNGETYSNPFSRPSTANFLCRDVNSNGRVELPVVSKLPGIPDAATLGPTSYLVKWVSFSPEGRYRTVTKTLMNPGENYWFRLPHSLYGKISASNDETTRTVTYIEAVPAEGGEGEEKLLGSPLFSIRAFTLSAWESRGATSGYELLTVQGDTAYGIQTLTRDAAYREAIKEVKENFQLLAE